MANPIPPFVCSTPPPIDDFEDISQIDDSTEIDFGEYESNTDAEMSNFDGPSIPNTPRHEEGTNNKINNLLIDNTEAVKTETIQVENNQKDIKSQGNNNNKQCLSNPQISLSKDNIIISLSKKNSLDNLTLNSEFEKVNTNEPQIIGDEQKSTYNLKYVDDRFESPPSLELTIQQVVSDENESSEKLSTSDSKDFNKEFRDNSFETNSESFPKEGSDRLQSKKNFSKEESDTLNLKENLTDPELKKINLEFADFIQSNIEPDAKYTLAENGYNSFNSKLTENFDNKVEQIFEKDKNTFKDCEKINFETNYNSRNENDKSMSFGNLFFEADFNSFDISISKCSNDIYENKEFISKNKEFIIENSESNEEISLENGIYFESFNTKELKNDSVPDVNLKSDEHSSENKAITLSEKINKKTKDVDNVDDDFDDEFGEFSDFKIASFSDTQINLGSTKSITSFNSNIHSNFDETIGSILNIMFPNGKNCDINFKLSNDTKLKDEKLNEHLIKTNLNNVDLANALDYQWGSSNARHVLIKSLGIDSRNILYGEKWNCSMPKYASNLGFTPLEPLKPTKSDTKSTSHQNSLLLGSNSSNFGANSKNNTINTSVPQAEFDWNSAGLVNPLDGNKKCNEENQSDIQIHTATIDVSKTNTSNPKLSTKIQNEPVETNLSAKYENDTTKNNSTIGRINKHKSVSTFNRNPENNSETSSLEFIPTNNNPKSSDIEGSSNNSKTKSTITSNDNSAELSSSTIFSIAATTTTSCITTTPAETPTNINFSLKVTKPIAVDESISSINKRHLINEDHSCAENYLDKNIQQSDYQDEFLKMGPTQTFVLPLKETHIFTPTKSENPISQSTTASIDDFVNNYQTNCSSTILSNSSVTNTTTIATIDFDYETAAAGTVINEKVIKKEYHDVEYDPNKFGLKPINSSQNKDNVTNLVCSGEPCDILSLNESKSGSWTFHLNSLSDDLKSIKIETNEPFSSHLQGNLSNSQVNITSSIPFNFSDSNLNSKNIISPSNELKENYNLNVEFEKNISNLFSLEDLKNSNSFQIPINKISLNSQKNSFDDEFTDFQSVLPQQDMCNKTSNMGTHQFPSNSFIMNQQEEKIFESSPVLSNKSIQSNSSSRNLTPTLSSDDRMILSPAILLPQSVPVQQNLSSYNKVKIDWPEPGINIDELARLESIFPQPKTKSLGFLIENVKDNSKEDAIINEDDWSDFISVPPLPTSVSNHSHSNSPRQIIKPPQNVTSNLNIIYNPQSPTKVASRSAVAGSHENPNNLNNFYGDDEDEWSDFISSTPVSINNYPHSVTNQHLNQGNLFASQQSKSFTNDESHFVSYVPSHQQKYHPQHNFSSYNSNNNNKISQYLLNNSIGGLSENQVNSGSNNMQLNSLKPTDFIPNHHIQHQLLQKQQEILQQSTSGNIGRSGNKISFIPDLSFSAPQNQFINISKKNIPRK